MLSDQLKNIRSQKGYSQEVLAEKSGLSVRTIQRVENGETQPRGDTLIRLTEALDVAPTEIMEWKKREDKTYLLVLNLSAISFVLFPLLGIILPLILWVTKRDEIKGVNKLGKELLNFQITWAALVFLGYMIQLVWAFNSYAYPSPSILINLIYSLGVLYLFDFGLVIFNTVKITQDRRVWYYPRVNLIR